MARLTPEQRRANKLVLSRARNLREKEQRTLIRIANAPVIAAKKEERRLARLAKERARNKERRLANLESAREKEKLKSRLLREKLKENPEELQRRKERDAIAVAKRRAVDPDGFREKQRLAQQKRMADAATREAVRKAEKERRARQRNQTASDQFFIMAGAAEEISKILPKQKK